MSLNPENITPAVHTPSTPILRLKNWPIPIALIAFLVFVSTQNFILFHTLSELFAITIAILLAVVSWHTYKFSRNHFLMYLGSGYFWVGVLDLMHALSYKGMHIFAVSGGANASTQYWLAARYAEATLLLTAPFFLTRKVSRLVTTVFFGSGTLIAWLAIDGGYIPETFIEGSGLTQFKVINEYIIIAMLIIGIDALNRRSKLLDKRVFHLMLASFLFTIAAELAFTLYVNVYSTTIVVGHIFKFISFWLIFVAAIRTTLTEPFQIMARGSSTYDAVPDPTIVVDKNGIIHQANKAACIDTGLSASEIIDKQCHDLFHPQRTSIDNCAICQHIRNGTMLNELELSFPENNRWRKFTLTPFETPGDMRGMVHVSPDISKRKADEEALLIQSNYDVLTKLPNRALATDRLNVAIKQAQHTRKHVGLMFADIDNFKNVNDTVGHAFGDKVIIEIAKRIQLIIKEDDTLARWGGDEFLIIVNGLDQLGNAEFIAERILRALTEPFVIDEKEFVFSVSIGISGFPDSGTNADALLSYADAAMHQAKREGKNKFRFFISDMNKRAEYHLEIEGLLRHAIKENELSLHFQPQIDITTQSIVGCEALLRWHNLKLGNIGPDIFIPIAEETGLIIALGDWVIRQACKHLVDMRASGYPGMYLSVNISSKQLKERDFLEKLQNQVTEFGISPASLILEITENILLGGEKEIIDLLTEIKRLGFRLSLDDFGTGYSSLSYLKKFPFSEIKIDRAFVKDITTDSANAALCRAIIAMAEGLNLTVVGEGVETEPQLQFLRHHKANIAQGFYFSKALPAQEFLDFLKKN